MKRLLPILPVLISLLLSACVSMDYKGQALPPLRDGEKVTVYYTPKQLPPNVRELGEITASAGKNWTIPELERKVRIFAAEHGANGLLIQSADQIPVGKIRPDQQENKQVKSWSVRDDSANTFQSFWDDMVNRYTKENAQEQVEVYNLKIKAKLLRLPDEVGKR